MAKKKLTKRQTKVRDKIAEGLKKHRADVDNPYAVATAQAKRGAKLKRSKK